ncbi:MAG: hypothetical protein RL091_3100, partial [Verrucomicrobiota bacterium]
NGMKSRERTHADAHFLHREPGVPIGIDVNATTGLYGIGVNAGYTTQDLFLGA